VEGGGRNAIFRLFLHALYFMQGKAKGREGGRDEERASALNANKIKHG